MKGRNPITYNKKVQKITTWYNRLIELRNQGKINDNNKQATKRKELKSLDYYINQIKKSNINRGER